MKLAFPTGVELKNHFPDSYESFVQVIDAQWEFGRARMQEALRSGINSRDHLRHNSLRTEKDIVRDSKFIAERTIAVGIRSSFRSRASRRRPSYAHGEMVETAPPPLRRNCVTLSNGLVPP